MARIVGVHGVGRQRLGGKALLKDWEPASRGLGTCSLDDTGDLVCASGGDVAVFTRR
ncbi:hypothetical protein [Streptomyces regalis]|uniref:hypothetical protein n=1 Tax=Streptomyces regalis TaxID=68262 RepID=UPI000B1DDF57|nr:hypothetical protein [Streptomyces regalis]